MRLVCTVPKAETGDSYQNDRMMAEALTHFLEGVIRLNVELLKHQPLPPLYRSHVRFRRQSPNRKEHFCPDVQTLYAVGHADCAPLCCARAAELRLQGTHATVKVYWRPPVNGKTTMHAEVRLPNGGAEDPSRRLGMVGIAQE